MLLDPANYVGREQAYVKHYFLAEYLEKLVFKIASVYDEIVFIDGFSGPWQNKGERFEDTSFGIALRALTLAKQSWATMANPARCRHVRMTAHLVERSEAAFAKLKALKTMFPDISIVAHNGDFSEIARPIAQGLSQNAFTFILVDPKGWKVDLLSIAPLIVRSHCEIVFNFMFDFINRFALSDDAATSQQLDRLIPGRDWRSRIRAIDVQARSGDNAEYRAPDARKRVLVEEFREALRAVGQYQFVAEVDVLRPAKDRTLYSLVYATRRPPGVEVFRDCHVRSLERQSDIRGRTKLKGRENKSGQMEILTSTNEMGPDRSMAFLTVEEQRARDVLRSLVPSTGAGVRWDSVWPQVLSRCVIRLNVLKRIANEDRKAGILEFSNWPQGAKRTPEDDYLVKRGRESVG